MSDVTAALIWFVTVMAGGLLIWPLALALCPRPLAAGILSKVLAPLVTALALFALATTRIAAFTQATVLIVALLIGTSWLVPSWRRATLLAWRTHNHALIGSDLALAIAFAGGVALRSFAPALDSLEKMMNIGFLSSLARTTTLPAADMWCANEPINYYYGGHLLVATWMKATGIRPTLAYWLAMATIFALMVVLAYQIASTLLSQASAISRRGRILGATLTSALITVGSNGHAVLYDPTSPLGLIGQALCRTWPQVAGRITSYWFPDSTRFIGYNPPSNDKTIHEFPCYSLIVGDLHAHLIDLIVVLSFGLILAVWMTTLSESRTPYAWLRPPSDATSKRSLTSVWLTLVKTPSLYALALVLAFMQTANVWDYVLYAPYLAVATLMLPLSTPTDRASRLGLVPLAMQASLLIGLFLRAPSPLFGVIGHGVAFVLSLILVAVWPCRWTRAGLFMTAIVTLANALAYPFNRSFDPLTKTIRLAKTHSSLYALAVLWGLMVVLAVTVAVSVQRLKGTALRRLLTLATGAAIVFLVTPELVYVADIYGAGFARANTMFKVTYQAFVLLMMTIGIGIGRWIGSKRRRDLIKGSVALLLILSVFWFPVRAVGQWFGPLTWSRMQSLDGLLTLAHTDAPELGGRSLTSVVDLIRWMNRHISGQPVIAEACGASYTHANAVSAFTGLPTPMGWSTHEWLWRTSKDRPDAYTTLVVPRQNDVRTLYTSPNIDDRRLIIARYAIRYIVLGPFETSAYACHMNDVEWRALGTWVYKNDDVALLKVSAPLTGPLK